MLHVSRTQNLYRPDNAFQYFGCMRIEGRLDPVTHNDTQKFCDDYPPKSQSEKESFKK